MVAVFVFLLLRLTPGDPAAVIAGDNANSQQVAEIREKLGLGQPLLTQFVIWGGKIARGDFGESFFFKKTVAELIAQRIEPTLALSVFTIVIAVLVAVPLGVIAAYKHDSWIDRLVMGFSVLGFSVPVFVFGYLLIYLFAIQLGVFPVQGYRRIADGFWPFAERLVLPACTLAVIYIALIARITRASVLEVLGEDYIRTAYAKGLTDGVVLMRHALRNAAVPIVTVIGIGIALLIGGVVVTESVYNIPGLGRLTGDRSQLHAARSEDPLLTAATDELLPSAADASAAAARSGAVHRLLHSTTVIIGGAIMLVMLVVALLAPALGTSDPARIDPTYRNKLPGSERSITLASGETATRTYWMGTDSLGRDVYSRVIYGARISLMIGTCVAAISVAIGLVIGLVSGYIRWLDGIVMRFMDGMMAIPGILLAIALVSVWGAGLGTVIIAIVVPEIPRVVRLVRSVVLSVREEPYVEAAISVGTPTPLILIRHVLPNTVAPVIVQGTYICASAILVEAILSFLGIGIPPETPTWGNIMAEGRTLFRVYPHNILFPGVFLAFTVLAVNMLGDGLRDTLDPRLSKRV
ncbi:MAG: ABC transporter permease subunit [Proteobacteria bacterium]|nr:ABC transporter permease subunit [Pseudomonadota bacterium]